jgi:cadherin-like protein
VVAGTAAASAATGLAADDAYTVPEDGELAVTADQGVLANDAAGTGLLCVIAYDTAGLQGTLGSANPDGSFAYTPPEDFNGATTFSYTVGTSIAGVCPTVSEGSGTVAITVTPVNDPPTARNDSFGVLSGRTLNVAAPGVLANDSDVDGDPLTAVLETGPSHGSLSLAANGGFSYTPNAGYTGSDVFSYHAFDGTDASQPRVVTLTVTALPPTRAPTAAPTTAPETVLPTLSPEPSPSESPLPSDSGLPSPSPSVPPLVATASPSPPPPIGGFPQAAGIPILAIAGLGLLIGLLTVAGVFFVQSQRAAARTAAEEAALGGEDADLDDLDDEA